MKTDHRNTKRKKILSMIRAQLHHPVMRLAWQLEIEQLNPAAGGKR